MFTSHNSIPSAINQPEASTVRPAKGIEVVDPFTIKPKNKKRTLQTKHIAQERSQLAFQEING